MPTPDQQRISEDRAQPRLMTLWWALRPLTSVVRFMQTGAHPDDETSALLAALTFRDGLNLSYACSTRGEGGQNDIGREAGTDLGALRTREMERAADVLGMRVYWLSTHPEDTITDFGFSKSGTETLARWDRARTVRRFVEIIRRDRPDVLCTTFLDVPGQHGHHRAMTELAHDAVAAAADPTETDAGPAWQVKKLYLPAWSGAGQAYDDDLPPPETTLTVPGQDREPMTGWEWARIGQQSRAMHRSQGMGRWTAQGAGQDWPLHLVRSHVPGPDQAIWSGLPRRLEDLAEIEGAEPIAAPLKAAGAAIARAVEDFPDAELVADALRTAHEAVRLARTGCPMDLAGEILHRLDAKDQQLSHALRLALGIEAHAEVEGTFVTAGSTVAVRTELGCGTAEAVDLAIECPVGWDMRDGQMTLPADAVHDPYPAVYDPMWPSAPRITLTIDGVRAALPFTSPPVVLPASRARLTPTVALLNRAKPGRRVTVAVDGIAPSSAQPGLAVPEGWQATRTETGFDLTAPDAVPIGTHTIGLHLDGAAAATVRQISHPHIAPTATARPAETRVGVVDIAVPEARVGYIGAGNDRVGQWLGAMGAEVTDLSEAELTEAALEACQSLVIGIFAMRFRPGLAAAMPRIHRWVEAGGTLLTFYHRPWDGWDPDRIPPRRIEIGQPSLRWRVTDETADVRVIADHAVLRTPNPIGTADWDGWVKERGLYFAKSWDPAYTPLLAMADPGETPLEGALLVGEIGAGRHVHTSLILHHQMDHLVPGAFRLIANLIAPRE